MKQFMLGCGFSVCVAALAGAALIAQGPAHAEIKDARGNIIGSAMLTSRAGGGVNIALDVKGLTPGAHALHIHTTPECDGPGFLSAGNHFNPLSKKHGMHNPEGAHAGDANNFLVASDGTAKVNVSAPGVTLGSEPNSVFTNGGTAVVIHGNADDMVSDPGGASGDRVACGLIQKK